MFLLKLFSVLPVGKQTPDNFFLAFPASGNRGRLKSKVKDIRLSSDWSVGTDNKPNSIGTGNISHEVKGNAYIWELLFIHFPISLIHCL
jgi:hypothetical protein